MSLCPQDTGLPGKCLGLLKLFSVLLQLLCSLRIVQALCPLRERHTCLSVDLSSPCPLPYHYCFQTISLSSLENPTQMKLKASTTHFSCSAVTTPPHMVMEDFSTQII